MIASPNQNQSLFPYREISTIAEERMNQFLELMDRFDTLDWATIKNIVTVGVWDVKERTKLFQIIREKETTNKPSQVQGLEYLLRSAVPSSMHIAESGGSFAGVGSMVFTPSKRYDDWEIYNPYLLIANFNEGKFGRWSGNPRSGKTNGACVLIEEWVSDGNLCISNIFKKTPSNTFDYVKDARGLFETVASYPRKKKWLFPYDEGGASGYGKGDASSLKARYMDKVCRIIGKLYGNVLYIDQRFLSVPQIVQDFATSKFHSIEPGIVHMELTDFPQLGSSFNRTVRHFPETSLPYDTRDIAAFEMNVNVEKLFQAMAGAEKPYDIMLDFLKTKDSEPPKGRKL
jgi:hypothetical protein